MSETTVEALIEGGNATAAPPLGPALGPTGVNIGQVVSTINEKTKDFEGMEVPVTVKVDDDTSEYEVIIGTPPAPALIIEELGIEKGSGEPRDNPVADVTLDTVQKLSRMKQDSLTGKNVKKRMNEILGTCRGMGVTCEGKPADDVIKMINDGEYDDRIQEES
jgi:large subunit ribosomal protein L11